MKKRQIVSLLLLMIAILGFGYASSDVMAATTSEAGNEASIEILEDYEPAKPPLPGVPKTPIKLPQTSDTQGKQSMMIGSLMVVGVAGIWLVKKRKELTK